MQRRPGCIHPLSSLLIAVLFLMSMQVVWADISHEAQDTILGEEIGNIVLPVAVNGGSEFSIPIEVRIKGEAVFQSVDGAHSVELSEVAGEVFRANYPLSLGAQSYQVTEHYTISVVSLSSLVGGGKSWDLTFAWPEPYEATGDAQQFTSELSLDGVKGEVSGDLTGGSTIIEDQLAITFIAVDDLAAGSEIHYRITYSGDYTKTSVLMDGSNPPPDGNEPGEGETDGEGEEQPEEPPAGENPEIPGDEEVPLATGDKLSIRETSGQLLYENVPLTMELPDLSDEPIEILATLDGMWYGKGNLVITPSGVLNHQIQIQSFEGILSVGYDLDLGDDVPNPLAVMLAATEGHIKQHGRDVGDDPSLLDLFMKARTIQVLDPELGQELPWPTDILGPMPSMLKIRDGELQFLKSTGNGNGNSGGPPDKEPGDTQDDVDEDVVAAKQEAEDALLEAQQARDDAESAEQNTESASVKDTQKAARRAASEVKRAQQAAEKARKEADKAASKANGKSKQQEMIQAAAEAAEAAKLVAQETEELARNLGRRASDLNQDGSNDILDLVRLGLSFGDRTPENTDTLEADLNGDGEVDILDIVIVGQTFGGGGVLIWLPSNEENQAAPSLTEGGNARVWLNIRERDPGMPEGYFQVEVLLDASQPIQAVQYDLMLDVNRFAVVSVESTLPSEKHAATYWREPLLDSGRGRLEGAALVSFGRGIAMGPNPVRLATITLEADNGLQDASVNKLHLANVRLASPGGQVVPVSVGNNMLPPVARIPNLFSLLPNFPNPFNPETWMPFHLADDAVVELLVYDATGGLIRTLNLGHLPAGKYETRESAAYWDGQNDAGESVASGLYFYQLRTSGYSETRPMIILK